MEENATVDMARHFTMPQLLRYCMPSIAMMIFTSVYGVVDGVFVSNFAGSVALAAVNWSWPLLMVLSAAGFMLGTGGSALVAKTRGEGNEERANRYFSMIVFFTLIFGIGLAVLGFFAMKPLFRAMGASGDMLAFALAYGYISLLSLPMFMLQNAFQALFVTAGKPKVGLFVIVLAGITNMVLDAVFIAGFGWGAAGAAAATAISEYVGGLAPLIYFLRRNGSYFRLRWTRFEWRAIGRACANGSSEMVGELSMSFVSMLFNFQLLRLVGEDGVAVYGAIMYVALLFIAIFIGFTIGTDPLMSYQYGAENDIEMQSLFKKSIAFMVLGGVIMFIVSELCAPIVASVFTGYDQALYELTTYAFRIFAISTLFIGMGIYGSALFTALNNGLVSALIALVRTLVFEGGAVMILPIFLGAEGIWFATPVAEAAACVLSIGFILALGKRYGFIRA